MIRRRAQHRPDWECSRCTFINKGYHTSCQMCQYQPTKAELANKGKKQKKAAPKIPTEDWACDSCTYINSLNHSRCEMCNNEYVAKEKASTETPPDEEEEPAFEKINVKSQWRCLLCDTVNDLCQDEQQRHHNLPSTFKPKKASAAKAAPAQSRCKLCDTPRIANKEIKRHMKIVLQIRDRIDQN